MYGKSETYKIHNYTSKMYQITLQYQTNHHYYLNDVTGKHLLLQHNQRQQSIEHQCIDKIYEVKIHSLEEWIYSIIHLIRRNTVKHKLIN